MEARLISNKLLSIYLNPLPLLGVGVKDSLKLTAYAVMASFTIPFLLLGGDVFSKATRIVNRAAPRGVTIKSEDGTFYCRNYDDFFVLWPSFEAELKGLFTCGSDQVFIDVGAHAGRYTVMVGKRARKVVSIEPNSENFEALKRNISLNALGNVEEMKFACWDESGLRLKLFLSPSPGKHSFVNPQTNFESVDSITLDHVLEVLDIQPSQVGLVKIDAEGAEFQIVKGGKKLFTLGGPRVIFEAFPASIGVVAEVLRSYGYEMIERVGEVNFVAEK
jgi:FkbM family methyltransferase